MRRCALPIIFLQLLFMELVSLVHFHAVFGFMLLKGLITEVNGQWLVRSFSSGAAAVADLTGGHTCSGRRGPCPKRPRRPHGRCAQEAHEMSRYIYKTKPALQSTVSKGFVNKS